MKNKIIIIIIICLLQFPLIASADQVLLGGSLYIDTVTGAFGVGTTSLTSLFTVSNSGQLQEPLSNTTALFTGFDNNPLRVSMDSFNSSNSFGSQIQFRRARGTTLSPSAVLTDDTIYSLAGAGWGDTGFGSASVGSISMHAGEDFTDASKPTHIRFNTTPSGSVTQTERMRITADGSVGIGTTTPWGKLGILQDSYSTPGFTMGTSTDSGPYGIQFHVTATSSTLVSNTVNGKRTEVGVRVGVGLWDYEGYGGLLDQLVVNGRTNSQGWLSATCDATVGATAISSDGVVGCEGFTFMEDNTGTMTATAPTGGGATFARITASTVAINNDGAGVFANGASAGWLTLASSTPVFEVNARIRNSTATTSQYFIGFTNITTGGTLYEVNPGRGCFFTASSTQANWQAICSTGTATTTVNTGIASTTSNAANGTGYQFRKFRIQADSTKAEFFIQATGSSNLIKVAEISTNYPSTLLLNAGMHYGIISQNTSSGFDLFRARFWWKDVLPSL